MRTNTPQRGSGTGTAIRFNNVETTRLPSRFTSCITFRRVHQTLRAPLRWKLPFGSRMELEELIALLS